MKAYYDPERKIVEIRTAPLPGMLEAPMEDGSPVLDGDWLSVLEVEDEFGETTSVAVVDPDKKQAKLDAIEAKKLEIDAEKDAKQAKKDKIKGMKTSDLKNDQDIKQAIIDILDYLGLS